MVARIKKSSKNGEGKASWRAFCNKWCKGTFDPSLHSAATLKAYLEGTQPAPKKPSADSSPRISGNPGGGPVEGRKIAQQESLHELPLQRRIDFARGMFSLNSTVPLGSISDRLNLSKADLLTCGLFDVSPIRGEPLQYEVSLHPANSNS